MWDADLMCTKTEVIWDVAVCCLVDLKSYSAPISSLQDATAWFAKHNKYSEIINTITGKLSCCKNFCFCLVDVFNYGYK